MGFLGPVTRLDGRLVRPHDIEVFATPEPGAVAGDGHPAAAGRLRGAGRAATPAAQPAVGAADPRLRPRSLELARGRAGSHGVGRVPLAAARSTADRRCLSVTASRLRGCAVEISAKTDYAVRALLSLAAHAPELVKVDVDHHRAGAAAQVRRGDPRRAAPGRPGAQPARRRRRLRAGPPGHRDHARRGHPRGRRPAGRGPRAAPARDRPTPASPSTCPRCGSRCGPACAGCSTRRRSPRCSAGKLPAHVAPHDRRAGCLAAALSRHVARSRRRHRRMRSTRAPVRRARPPLPHPAAA